MSLNYVQLTTLIQQYTEVDETTFVTNIPTFITNAETLINNSVQLPAFRVNVTGTFTPGFQYIDLPTDFLSIFSLAVIDPVTGNYHYLLNKDVNYIREAFPYPATSGLPKYYSMFDNTAFLVGPTPDQGYTVEMHYYAYPESITTAGTSWIGNEFPNALLWGSIVEAYIYLKGEQDLIQLYQQKFDQILQQMIQLGDGKNRQDNYRTLQVRKDVTQ
jgi:hypothetical protein